jgi:DNA-binding MarR family transcriptional regulator
MRRPPPQSSRRRPVHAYQYFCHPPTMPKPSNGRPEELVAVADSMRRIIQALRVSSSAAEQRLGISGAQLFVLELLVGAPARSINELAARTSTRQSTVSVVVGRLAARRLVTRARSTEDGRRSTITLTPAGRALVRMAPPAAQSRLLDGLRRLPRRDLLLLRRILETLATEMGARGGRAQMFFEQSTRQPNSRRRPRSAARVTGARRAGDNGTSRAR